MEPSPRAVPPQVELPALRALRADGFDGPRAIDVDRAVRRLDASAGAQSLGRCAASLRRALHAGGMDTSNNPTVARDYGPYLESRGFRRVDTDDYTPHRGDVVVLQPPDGVGPGHVAMYNGRQWVSDFRQRDLWGGPEFRGRSSFEIFRP